MKIAILGGGLTGITLARLYSEKGHEVVVLEKEKEYGGLCRSRTDQGFTFDTGGSHIIFSRDTEVLAFMLRMLEHNREMRKRNTKIYHRGCYIKYPFENGLHELEKEECFFCINEFIRNLIAVEKGEIKPPHNFHEWTYYTFGKGIANLYLIPYNEKIWKYPTQRMSCHWVEGRIPRPPVEDVIKSAIGMETEGYTHQIRFAYPRSGGIKALVEAIAAPIESTIRCGFAVSALGRQGDQYVIGNGEEEIMADRVISTLPVQALLNVLPDVPPELLVACGNLQYNSLYCVGIGVKGEVPPYSWVYIPDPRTGLFNRISFPSGYSPETAPSGHASILVEITFREGDEVDSFQEDEIVDQVLTSLQAMQLISGPEDVVYTYIERQRYAYVIYDLDYQKNIALVRDFVRCRGIGLVGRFAEFEYLNMDDCIRHAMNFVREHPCG
ncbi:MAG: FAD-dependent oxidoreductase [Methanomicrobiales archaeon]|nr:FAD-dependent oxidoreductase [Methanomicrobiales archaeon]